MSLEISIHRSVDHKHIVKFYNFFEDENFIYIILEICGKRSMMEMHKRRKTITEPELRYYVRQIALACVYLHDNKIVHRDLKLGNLFLNDDMHIKVGDFGLASKLCPGERKKTLCGTPNYIAPEVLLEAGHGYEVDVWSLGCIVYTLSVGKPPFETDELKSTYRRIKKNDYTIPMHINPQLAGFISKMLRADPTKRPTMRAILNDPYLAGNYIPSALPTSCLSIAPRANESNRLSILCGDSPRRPFSEMANHLKKETIHEMPNHGLEKGPSDFYLSELREQVNKLLSSNRLKLKMPMSEDEAEHPAAMPFFWISKWVDYTDKYGIGYQLCDNSIGVLFNDNTKLILMPDETNFHYVERNSEEQYYKYNSSPDHLLKKTTLFRYFRNYMNSHLMKMGEKQKALLDEKEEMARVPHINCWIRTGSAIVFHLTNGTVQVLIACFILLSDDLSLILYPRFFQINFFKDHVKLILCPHMAAVTFVNEQGEFKSYKFSLLEEYGINNELHQRLKYAKEVLEHLYKKSVSA